MTFLAPLVPAAESALGAYGPMALNAAEGYVASEAPTIAKYLGKAVNFNGEFTPKEILDHIKEKGLTKEGREELVNIAHKAVKVGGKIGNEAVSFAQKFGLGQKKADQAKNFIAKKSENIHNVLGKINKIQKLF